MADGAPVRRFRIASLLKWIVSVAFLLVLASAVSTRNIAQLLSNPDWTMVGVSLGITAAMIAVSCWKWRFVLQRTWPEVRYGFLVRVYLIGYFFSNLLPSVVGGDVARITYVGRRSNDMAGSAVSVFVERFSGILVLLALTIIAPCLRPSLYASLYIQGAVALAAALLSGLVVAALCRVAPGSAVARFVQARWEDCWRALRALVAVPWPAGGSRVEALRCAVERRAEKFLSKLGTTLTWIKDEPRALLTIMLQTVLFYSITWCNVFVALRVFDISVPFFGLCAVVPAIMLVAMIPVSQASIGLAEGCYVVYLGLLGVGREEALAAALLLRVKFLLVGVIGFAIYHVEGSKISRDGIESENARS